MSNPAVRPTLRPLDSFTLAEFMALPVHVRRAVAEAFGVRYLGGPRFKLPTKRERAASKSTQQRKVQSS